MADRSIIDFKCEVRCSIVVVTCLRAAGFSLMPAHHHHHQPPCSNSDSQWVLKFLQKDSVHRLCALSVGLLFPASQSVPCFCFCGDYEELLTAVQGGVVESCNVDKPPGVARWILVFRNTCDDTRTGACSSGSVLLSTYKHSVERGACWRSAELSDRPTSLVCRVPVTALNQGRTHLFTLPGQTNSEFTDFRGGRDLYFHPW